MKSFEEIVTAVVSAIGRYSPTDSTIHMESQGGRAIVRVPNIPPGSGGLVWVDSFVKLTDQGMEGGVLEAPFVETHDWYAMRFEGREVVVYTNTPPQQAILFPQKPSVALIAIGGPSGAGKTSAAAEIQRLRPGFLCRYPAFTTRPRRLFEEDGAEYHFCNLEELQRAHLNPRFANFVEARGHWYWTDPGKAFSGIWRGNCKAHASFVSQRKQFEERLRWFPMLKWFWIDASEEVIRARLERRGDDDVQRSLDYNRRLFDEPKEELIAMRVSSDKLSPEEIARIILALCDEEIRKTGEGYEGNCDDL